MVWYRKAADQGYSDAQLRLGALYESGFGVQRDYGQAKAWYQKAADQGNADAQCVLGWLYLNGSGVKQDYAQAMAWFQKAADQNNAQGQYSVGLLMKAAGASGRITRKPGRGFKRPPNRTIRTRN